MIQVQATHGSVKVVFTLYGETPPERVTEELKLANYRAQQLEPIKARPPRVFRRDEQW